MDSNFDAWADVYDAVYSYVREDIPFYVNAAGESGGPVLELGCGTGRVAIPIARSGIDIVGLDSSKPMLEQARRKAASLPASIGDLQLVAADMRDFSFQRRFAAVLIPFRGFLSLLTVEDQTRTLLNVRDHLADGGRLIFNIFVPQPETLLQDGQVPYHFRDVTDPDTGLKYVLWQQNSYDHHDQIVNTRVIGEQLDSDGTVARRFYRDFQLRYAYRWEIYHLLKSCGFEVVALHGDFDESMFEEGSSEMVWVARAA